MGGTHPDGYKQIKIDGRMYLAHRLAWFYMTGAWPEHNLDHINRNRADNRWANLRLAPGTLNENNRSTPHNNTSGAMGVNKNAKGLWVARGVKNGKRVFLKSSKDFSVALQARLDYERETGIRYATA